METKPLLFFDWLLRSSWQASLLIGLILAVQWLFRNRIAPRWRYALWLIVFVRLALPISPQSALSVFNFAKIETRRVPLLKEIQTTSSPAEATLRSGSREGVKAQAWRPKWLDRFDDRESEVRVQVAGSSRTIKTPHLIYWAGFVVWVAGFMLLLGRWTWQNGCVLWRLRASQRIDEPDLIELFDECRDLSKIRRKVHFLSVNERCAPALYGVFRLRLLLPRGLLTNFKREELQHILLHELAHVKRWDSVANAFIAVLRMLHWFNPLVWLAFRNLALDRELVCDELALGWLKQGENKAYGATIIKLLESAPLRPPTFTTVGILEDYGQLVTRMQCIGRYRKSEAAPVGSLFLLALVAAVSLTDARTATQEPLQADRGQSESVTRTLFLKEEDEMSSWLSPDESKIAYTEWGESSGNVVVRDLQTRKLWKLTSADTNHPGAYPSPGMLTWSPDSKQIAFDWWSPDGKTNEVELRIASADGHERKRIRVDDRKRAYWPRDWSRDGKLLLCERYDGKAARELAVVAVDSGELRVVLNDLNIKIRMGTGSHARFSPDAKHIVFQQTLDGNRDVYSVTVADGQLEKLTDSPADDGNPVWSLDGKHVLFVTDRRGQWDLWAVPVNGGKRAGEPFLVRPGYGDLYTEINAQGKIVYYALPTIRADYLITVNPETGETSSPKQVHVDATAELVSAGASGLSVAWVPENRFCYWRKTTLYVASLDGKEEVYPTRLRSVEQFRVSHDGKWISIQGRNEQNQGGLFALNLERKAVETLLLTDEYRIVGAKGDSTEVLVQKNREFSTINFETKKVRKL